MEIIILKKQSKGAGCVLTSLKKVTKNKKIIKIQNPMVF